MQQLLLFHRCLMSRTPIPKIQQNTRPSTTQRVQIPATAASDTAAAVAAAAAAAAAIAAAPAIATAAKAAAAAAAAARGELGLYRKRVLKNDIKELIIGLELNLMRRQMPQKRRPSAATLKGLNEMFVDARTKRFESINK